MSLTAKYFSLAYDSEAATKGVALKSSYLSVRLIKISGELADVVNSYYTNVLLNGKCVDPETRNLYVFYIDTLFNSAWIIEINIDDRTQTIVYYDKYNVIGFDRLHKIYNPKVINGRLIWTDGLDNHIYQMDIERAKNSFYYGIGYGEYPDTVEWNNVSTFQPNQIVSHSKYFYKALVENTNVEPGTDDNAWVELCLIEDAYYSMNVENFYFAPIPPKNPPTVEYYSDDTRKINNLKRTLFQVAYRYVYIDYRRSTLSPASIVPLPQAEEEAATGLVNEMISLNNSLKITINTGNEEVRAIEVYARSSDDKSSWFLIETIEKFSAQERDAEEAAEEAEEEPYDPTIIEDAYIFVVDEDGITYIIDEGECYIISD